MNISVEVPAEAKGVRCPSTRVTGSYKLSDTSLRSSGRALYVLNLGAISLGSRYN